jgi:hypothetical protein
MADLETYGKGEIRREGGVIKVRAIEGVFGVRFPDGREEGTTSTSFTNLTTSHFMTDSEAWDIFDRTARRRLGMTGEEFLAKWDAGEFPDPDEQDGVMTVAMLIPLVRSVGP